VTAIGLLVCVEASSRSAIARDLEGRADASQVVVVVNAASADSVRVGERYARERLVPSDQIIRLSTLPADPPDGIDRVVYDRDIQAPIANWLARNQAQDRILFIVLTKGIPLRINGGREQNAASVDSELALLYRRMTGRPVPTGGPLPNPYYLGAQPISSAKPFSRVDHDIYLVTRLDGYTVADIEGLIDRAAHPSRDGRFVLDEKWSLTDKGNVWLRTAADRLRAAGLGPDRVELDESAAVITDRVDVLGYYSWGSNDPAIRRRSFNLQFRPGAIAAMFVSTDGRTFREPPEQWMPGNWDDKSTWFAGTPQSLAGDLIRAGVTGVAGHVAEPLLGNTIRPDILFPAYLAGFSLAEAYYLAMPSLSWMTVVVGDPLCAPFAGRARETTGSPMDPETELPRTFSERRLTVLTRSGAPQAALTRVLLAESRIARGDSRGAIAPLEEAVRLAPALTSAKHMLAAVYTAAERHDAAITVYREILSASPDDVGALNNAAYALSVKKGAVQEALPLAERGHSLAPQSGVVADTLGWIHHLLGNNGRAAELLTEAARLSPDVAEIRLHLARVLLERGELEPARAQVKEAAALDAGIMRSEEYRTVAERLSRSQP
jgi:uncharacterized protein (TIGR03790 family)